MPIEWADPWDTASRGPHRNRSAISLSLPSASCLLWFTSCHQSLAVSPIISHLHTRRSLGHHHHHNDLRIRLLLCKENKPRNPSLDKILILRRILTFKRFVERFLRVTLNDRLPPKSTELIHSDSTTETSSYPRVNKVLLLRRCL